MTLDNANAQIGKLTAELAAEKAKVETLTEELIGLYSEIDQAIATHTCHGEGCNICSLAAPAVDGEPEVE